jgi:hypothetical protein
MYSCLPTYPVKSGSHLTGLGPEDRTGAVKIFTFLELGKTIYFSFGHYLVNNVPNDPQKNACDRIPIETLS